MVPLLDIFQIDSGGRVLWRGAVESVEAANVRIRTFAQSSPGEYLILNQLNGERVRVTMPGLEQNNKSPKPSVEPLGRE